VADQVAIKIKVIDGEVVWFRWWREFVFWIVGLTEGIRRYGRSARGMKL
jgi:hypothetical protein